MGRREVLLPDRRACLPASPAFGLQPEMLIPQQSYAESSWQAGLGKAGVTQCTAASTRAIPCGRTWLVTMARVGDPPGAMRLAGVWSHQAWSLAESVPGLAAHSPSVPHETLRGWRCLHPMSHVLGGAQGVLRVTGGGRGAGSLLCPPSLHLPSSSVSSSSRTH